MKKSLCLLILLLTFAVPVAAQDHPRAELFLGYSALVTPSEKWTDPTDPTIWLKREVGYVNGWNASLAVNATGWLGFVGDFAGHYGPIDFTLVDGPDKATVGFRSRFQQYLVGPQFSVRKSSSTVFFRALVGVASMRDIDLDSNEDVIYVTRKGFAYGGGVGVDLKISDRIAWRMIQADYIRVRFGNPKLIINNVKISDSYSYGAVRVSTGIVIKN